MRTLLFGLIISTCTMIGVAAEQVDKPIFLGIIDEDISPDKMQAYMQARIAQAEVSAQYKDEFAYLTFVKDFHVHTAVFFRSFSQLDEMPEKMKRWNEKTGGKSMEIEKQKMACANRVSISINVARRDLGYFPKGYDSWPDWTEPCYQSIAIYHIKPGKYEEAEAVAKKIKAYHAKNQSPMAYIMEERIIGQDTPAFIAISFSKDKAAFVEMERKMEASRGQELEALMAEGAAVISKIERKEARFVPEASYFPKDFLE